MKTNKLWSIMMMFVLVLGTSFVLSSCSKDDDIADAGITNDSTSAEDNLPSAAKAFVGGWSDQSTFSYFFYADGTSVQETGSGNYIDGSWTFNPETNILVSTAGSIQWNVTLSTESEWAGITVENTKARFYKKLSNNDYIGKTIVDDANRSLRWKESNSGEYISINRDLSCWFAFMEEKDYWKEYKIRFSDDDNPNDYTVPITIYPIKNSWLGSSDTGTITLKDPHNYMKRTLIITLNRHNVSYTFHLEKI